MRSLLPLGCKRLSVSGGLVAGGESELTCLNPAALCQLLSRHAQSPALLSSLSSKLLRGQTLSTALQKSRLFQLLCRHTGLGGELFCRQTELPCLLG